MYHITNRMTPSAYHTSLVCVDSYCDGILQGRIYNAYHRMEVFQSLSQFIIKMERLLDDLQTPQAYMVPRTFQPVLHRVADASIPLRPQKGAAATFEVQIRFRQHTSWQGSVLWKERQLEKSFRSVLELILLLDNALQESGRRHLA